MLEKSKSLSLTHRSIADMSEDEVVERLLSDPLWPYEMFQLHGVPHGSSWRTRVSLSTAPGQFRGDVDVLLCRPDRPAEAVAYEVKRIKFGLSALRPGGKPNKLHEFKKAVEQANRLAQVGFSQVYLHIIVVVDSREQNDGRVTFRGLSSQLKSLVNSVISLHGLDKRVGLCDLEFTQPMDHPPFSVGTHGLHLRRLATATAQPPELTDWVVRMFSE